MSLLSETASRPDLLGGVQNFLPKDSSASLCRHQHVRFHSRNRNWKVSTIRLRTHTPRRRGPGGRPASFRRFDAEPTTFSGSESYLRGRNANPGGAGATSVRGYCSCPRKHFWYTDEADDMHGPSPSGRNVKWRLSATVRRSINHCLSVLFAPY
jgi:hypothetical protein